MLLETARRRKEAGFTSVEVLVACVVFAIIVIGLTSAYNSIHRSYVLARQYNELYTVLSACPEVDRAIQFDSISNASNCYPNNTFTVENGQGATTTYSPTLTVTNTAALGASDPLKSVPDSKVININVNFLKPYNNNPPLQIRMLITRNGIAQS
jgi:Tfp pilus assembly protein PilV